MGSWDALIKDGAEKMEEFWWLLVFPGGVFSLTLFFAQFPRRRPPRRPRRAVIERLNREIAEAQKRGTKPTPALPLFSRVSAFPWFRD
jgi:hypothetical protein